MLSRRAALGGDWEQKIARLTVERAFEHRFKRWQPWLFDRRAPTERGQLQKLQSNSQRERFGGWHATARNRPSETANRVASQGPRFFLSRLPLTRCARATVLWSYAALFSSQRSLILFKTLAQYSFALCFFLNCPL